MRKLWLCLFYALCVFTIVFSLFWMALPRLPLGRADSAEETPVPSLPSISVQAVPETGSTTYYLCDEGGLRLPSETELRQLLEDLGG